MSNTQRTDERCHDCLRPLDGQNCRAGGVHDLPTPTDDSVVDWEKEFDAMFPDGLYDCIPDGEVYFGEPRSEFEQVKSFIRTHIENARREERERIYAELEKMKVVYETMDTGSALKALRAKDPTTNVTNKES